MRILNNQRFFITNFCFCFFTALSFESYYLLSAAANYNDCNENDDPAVLIISKK